MRGSYHIISDCVDYIPLDECMNLDLLAAFLADQHLRRLAQGTILTGSARIKAYLSYCEKISLDPLRAGREDFLQYLRHRQDRGVKHGTLKGDFSALSSFYELLEEQNKSNSAREIVAIRKRYLRQYKPDAEERQIISIEQAASMVAGTIDTRDRAILLLLLKTGIRRGELASLDLSDISLEGLSIRLKPTGKRSNRLVFFDEEASAALQRWLKARARRAGSEPALFLASDGKRLGSRGIWSAVVRAAERAGLHSPGAPLEKRFGPHCCRHFYTSHLLRNGMRREYGELLPRPKGRGFRLLLPDRRSSPSGSLPVLSEFSVRPSSSGACMQRSQSQAISSQKVIG
jgi:integrase/recombinase XerD